MRRHHYLTYSLLIAALVGVIVLIAYRRQEYSCPTGTRATALTIPPYPHAQQETPLHLAGDGDHVQHIRFQTADPPAAVIAFYTDQLAAAGWTSASDAHETVLRFGHTEALPIYSLELEVTPQAVQSTMVRIRLLWGSCTRE